MTIQFRPASKGFWSEILNGGDGWPAWIRDLDGKSGVYFIRSKESKKVLYIGESHTDRLKKTLLHHFQKWEGKTAGPTYSRHDVELAALVTKKSRAVAVQNQFIRKMKPRDNTAENPAASDSNPF